MTELPVLADISVRASPLRQLGFAATHVGLLLIAIMFSFSATIHMAKTVDDVVIVAAFIVIVTTLTTAASILTSVTIQSECEHAAITKQLKKIYDDVREHKRLPHSYLIRSGATSQPVIVVKVRQDRTSTDYAVVRNAR